LNLCITKFIIAKAVVDALETLLVVDETFKEHPTANRELKFSKKNAIISSPSLSLELFEAMNFA